MKKKKCIFGLGVTGKAVAQFFLEEGYQVIGIDKNVSNLPGVDCLTEASEIPYEELDQIILSPGISPLHPLVVEAKKRGIEVIGEIELAFRELKCPVVGITGTNGKTTTTALVEHVLNACGYKAEALGNFGTPLISRVKQEGIAVVELSSFQLETLQTPKLDVAAILNITPDHLDRYLSFESYAEAKFAIQKVLKSEGLFVLEDKTFENFGFLVERKPRLYGWNHSPFSTKDLSKKKNPDEENRMAAFVITRYFGVTEDQFNEAASTFIKSPHRIEFVTEVKGIKFWNDSKGTNIDATLRAVEAMEGPVVLIAGGVDKGFPYTSWIEPFKGKVREMVLIGESQAKMQRDLSTHVSLKQADSLKEATAWAFTHAKEGDNVLLSPGCASFDMFRDYKDRGEQYKSLVRSLS